MKVKKISVRNMSGTLTDNEMKNVVGGYDWNDCQNCNYSYNYLGGGSYSNSGIFCGGVDAIGAWIDNEVPKFDGLDYIIVSCQM